MSDGFVVDDEALDAHARKVDELAGRMRQAAAAGRPLGLGAYGLVGQVFAATAAGAAVTGSATVGALAERTGGLGAGVRAAREEYLRVERQNTAHIEGLR